MLLLLFNNIYSNLSIFNLGDPDQNSPVYALAAELRNFYIFTK
jgi:hypothetical protein